MLGGYYKIIDSLLQKNVIPAVSNSKKQRLYIEEIIRVKGIKNLEVITCDINDLVLTEKFDRVVSIEMFEHMRNYHALFANISEFLNEEGKLFVHSFCHCQLPFTYEVKVPMRLLSDGLTGVSSL